jgi:hypothetical protein
MLERGESFPTVPYAAFIEAFAAVLDRHPSSGRPTSAGTPRPSTSSPCAPFPGGPAPAPLGASLARYRVEFAAARAWLDAYRARIDDVDLRLAERARPLTAG